MFPPTQMLVTGVASYLILGDEFAPLVSAHKGSVIIEGDLTFVC